MKTHRAAFEGAFFATASLWMSLQKERNEYHSIAMQAKMSLRILGLSTERFDLICGGNDFKDLMLKGIDELKLMSVEVETRYDEVHARCFNLGMHCGNLFGVITLGSQVPGYLSVVPLYITNIAESEACIPIALPPVTTIRTLAQKGISVDVFISLVKQVVKLLEEYVPDTRVVAILFIAADPTNASRLRLGEEFREIKEQLTLAKQRERFILALPCLSLRPRDIARALLDVQPQIVHFSGHGTPKGALCFEDESRQAHVVDPGALAALFEQFSRQVKCVVLNACYAENQARAIAEHIDYVVGMKREISDKAAIAFSVGFYQALSAGKTVEEAFELGRIQIQLQGFPEHLVPVLIKKGQI